jgi:hypothetical protein
VRFVTFKNLYFMKDWYPGQDSKRAVFLENFVANMDKACGMLGVPTSTYAESIAAARAWLAAYAQRQEAQRDFDSALLTFQKQAAATEKNVRTAAKQIKGSMNVPVEVLTLLELTGGGEALTLRADAQAPRLAVSVELGTVVLKYRKLGHQAVLLYSCRTGEDAFSLLGTYTLGRIEDSRPNRVPGQPEQRQYYAVYMDKDQPTGSQSGTVSVVVGDKPVAALGR